MRDPSSSVRRFGEAIEGDRFDRRGSCAGFPLFDGEAEAYSAPTSGVERFTADGKSIDQSFGTGGVTELPEFAEAVVAAHDGSIYAPQRVYDDATDNPGRDSVIRLTTTGQLDPTWGSGGRVDVQSAKDSRTQRVALQSDGRVIILGYNKDENYVLRIWN